MEEFTSTISLNQTMKLRWGNEMEGGFSVTLQLNESPTMDELHSQVIVVRKNRA